MKNKTVIVLALSCLIFGAACSSNNNLALTGETDVPIQNDITVPNKPHQYGGWYCPDNLRGFPAVDIADWKKVPVVNGRMATEEEARNGTSLIFVDPVEYPDAKPLNIVMPKLASFYNENTKRNELIIVIQAINVSSDSIVGFRYLNGGNGSARLNEVRFLSDGEIQKISPSKFVSLSITINAPQDAIWEVLTKTDYTKKLQTTFDKENQLKTDWRATSNVNYHYQNAGTLTAPFGGKIFGCFYVQNDYEKLNYTEKFLLLENQETHNTELIITCGPYANDFEEQKYVLDNWSQKVKELSEENRK